MSFSSTARTGVLAIVLAGAMTLGVGAAKPAVAWGETLEDLQAKVEQTNDALSAANDKVAIPARIKHTSFLIPFFIWSSSSADLFI